MKELENIVFLLDNGIITVGEFKKTFRIYYGDISNSLISKILFNYRRLKFKNERANKEIVVS